MSFRLPPRCGDTIQQALSRGGASLDAEARAGVGKFIRSQLNRDGGFCGRSAASDLYYTVFGLECARAVALELPTEAIRDFVETRASTPLDFVHLTCLARCLDMLWPGDALPAWGVSLQGRLGQHACAEGGHHRKPAQRKGSVYESFLGALANEALERRFPDRRVGEDIGQKHASLEMGVPSPLGQRLTSLCQGSGGFTNGDGLAAASTPVTAAALLLLHVLNQPIPPKSVEWLLNRQCARGGFAAAALVPLSDLLSTATALQALSCIGELRGVKLDACLDFVTGCWDDSGGFHAHALDRTPDCEYTFYGLLALGNLVADPAT